MSARDEIRFTARVSIPLGFFPAEYRPALIDFREFGKTKFGIVQNHLVGFAMEGDADAVQQIAASTYTTVVAREELNPAQRIWLIFATSAMINSRSIAVAMCKIGPYDRKGAPKGTWKGYSACVDVINELVDGRAASIEEAWARVAEKLHLDATSVKRYWSEHKETVCTDFEITNPEMRGATQLSGRQMIKEITARNRKARTNTDRE